MRLLRIFTCGLFVLSLSASAQAQTDTNTTTLLGQWDFNTANLAVSTAGSPLQFVGGLEGTFETTQINGRPAGVMRLPAATPQQGLLAVFNHVANGGGTNLNQYTILMDIMWPGESDGLWRGLFNASTNNTDDAEIFVNPDNQVGIYNNYALTLPSESWHRLVLVYDLTTNAMTRYLNGDTNVTAQILEETGLDSRFSLRGGVLLFADNDGETAPVYVNSIQLRAGAMSPEEIQELGGTSSGGLGEGADPVGDIRIESITRSGDNVMITVSGGRNVQLLKKVTLNNATWQNVGTPSNSGTFTVPIAEATSFFQLELR